jgi:hypothetical protein
VKAAQLSGKTLGFTMTRERQTKFVAAWFGLGFLILFIAAFSISSYEYLTTPNFEGLYDMPKSQQTISGWLALQPAFLTEYCLVGAVGGFVGLVGGLAAARVRKREA